MEKFARKYINRGADNNPIWQLLPEQCEPTCDGYDIANTLKQAFVKEFTEKNGTPLWRVMFDAIGADAFGDAFNNSSGEPDPAVMVNKIHLRYHTRMEPVTYFYSRDITDYIVTWPSSRFYNVNGWYPYGNGGYDAWARSQMFFGIRENHPSSYQALQSSLTYSYHRGGGSSDVYNMNSSNYGTHPWAPEEWGNPSLKEEWPPYWLINPVSDTWAGIINSGGDVGRGPYNTVYSSVQILDYRFVTTMQQFLDLLMWELTFFVYGSSGDKILYPNGESIYGQYPSGSHQFVSGSLSKHVSTYQESSSWSPGGSSASTATTTINEQGSLLIPFMDLDWCSEQSNP